MAGRPPKVTEVQQEQRPAQPTVTRVVANTTDQVQYVNNPDEQVWVMNLKTGIPSYYTAGSAARLVKKYPKDFQMMP